VSVWDSLIGQDEVADVFARAVSDPRGPAMTHAWLVTGPPGSGRSTAAAAFAAALQCDSQGCGECAVCRTTLSGIHPDVEIVRSEALSYGVDDARSLIERSSVVPADSRWHVVIIEDADRFTEEAANVMLKILEEPTSHLVWLLCAPSPEDVLPTIRSRTRLVHLRTPSTAEVTEALHTRYAIEPALAAFAARASQGHIGRARALATDAGVRERRQEVMRIPSRLRDLSGCFAAAGDLLTAATQDASSITDELDAREKDDLRRAYGEGAEGVTSARISRLSKSAANDLEKAQKSRRKRAIVDQVDRSLLDLLAYYRDVLVVQVGADVPLINDEMRAAIQREATQAHPADTVGRLEALNHARMAVKANGALPLVLEALMVELKDPQVLARS
jgi:DNA polymerase III subunit delta'